MTLSHAERSEAHELLTVARALIATPKQWTKGAYEDRLEDGTQCFCLLGALKRAAAKNESHRWTLSETANDRYCRLRRIVVACLPFGTGYQHLHHFNDDARRTHDEVLAVLDRALERTKPCD